MKQKRAGRAPIFRLWHKVFLVSLAFVMAAVNITAYTISSGGFREIIRRETAAAAERHNYLSSVISNNAAYERLKSGKILLGQNDCANLISDIVKANSSSQKSSAVYDERGNLIGKSYLDMPDVPDSLKNSMESGKIVTEISETDGSKYIYTASSMSIEGQDFILYTCTNADDIYNSYSDQLDLAWLLSVIVSSAVALILLISVWVMMRPVGYVNRSLRRIAGGEYSLRLDVAGSAEICELSDNINSMADSIEENMDELQRVADGRKQFIDNFAHEMKTPLTSIMGFADILRIKKDVGVRQRREFAGIIVEEAKRLRGLSGKLLELATADSVKFDISKIRARELFSEIYASVFPILAKNRMTLTCSADDITLRADKELLKSLMYNLIDNAVKASSPEGEIRAGCRLIQGGAALYVSDDGVGMDKEHLRRVTEPFYMVDKSRSRSFGGAGLGLALCDKIAKGHKGRLKIESVPGKGTTVMVVFGPDFLYFDKTDAKEGGAV